MATATRRAASLSLGQFRHLTSVDSFTGRMPEHDSRMVMTHKGQDFELAFKRREVESGPEVYRACDALQQTISRLYRQAGIKLGSSHSGRRSLAARFLAATGDIETVQTSWATSTWITASHNCPLIRIRSAEPLSWPLPSYSTQ